MGLGHLERKIVEPSIQVHSHKYFGPWRSIDPKGGRFDVLEDEKCREFQAWEMRCTSPNIVADLSVHLMLLLSCPI